MYQIVIGVASKSMLEANQYRMVNYPTKRAEYQIYSFVLLDSGDSLPELFIRDPIKLSIFNKSINTIGNLINRRHHIKATHISLQSHCDRSNRHCQAKLLIIHIPY